MSPAAALRKGEDWLVKSYNNQDKIESEQKRNAVGKEIDATWGEEVISCQI